MGRGGTCNHCGAHFQLPSIWRHRSRLAGTYVRKNALPAVRWILCAPFAIVSYLTLIGMRPDEFAGMSQAERLLILEARKQTKIQRSNRSDMSCCLGCLVIILVLVFTPAWAVIAAILGIAGAN